MKNNIKFLFLLLITSVGYSQQLYFEAGKTLSSFDYLNSNEQKLDNLQSTFHSFLAIGYRNQLFIEKLNGSLGLAYAGYGAIGSDNTVGNFMEWNINYLEFKAGLDFELFKIKQIALYVKGTSTAGIFMQGTQVLNSKVINLKNNDDFNTLIVHFNAGIGFSRPISEDVAIFAQYMYGKTLNMASGNENLKIISNSVSFGLLMNIYKKSPKNQHN